MSNGRPRWTLLGMGSGPRKVPETLIAVAAFLLGSIIAVVAALALSWGLGWW